MERGLVGDLGLMGSALVMDLSTETLLTLTLINPLDVYKLVTVDLLHTSLDVLGPAGAYATEELGAALALALAVWMAIPPQVAVLAMALSSLSVVGNAARLAYGVPRTPTDYRPQAT